MKDAGIEARLFEQRVREAAAAATALAAPADAWERVVARRRAGELVLLPTDVARAGTATWTGRSMRIAALLLIVGGAAAAAMLPASPVRQWLESVFTTRHATDEDPAATVSGDSVSSAPHPVPETTLVLEPANGGIVVALEAPEQDVTVRVRFVAAGEAEVRATGSAASAQFRSGTGRLTIANARGGSIVLTVPRTTSRVRVEVDGQPYLTKENGRIQVLAPAADTASSEILLQIRR